MNEKKEKINEKINVELGGMEIFGTTSNKEIAGYQTSGDIENAGQLDKGFKRPEGPKASAEEDQPKD